MKLWIIVVAIATWFVVRAFFGLTHTILTEKQSVLGEDLVEPKGRYEARAMVLWLVLTPPAAAAMWFFLVWLGEAYVSRLGEAVISIIPDGVAWALVAFFFGMLAAIYPAYLFVMIKLRGRYMDFLRLGKELGDDFKASRLLYMVFVGLWLLFTLAMLDWYVLLTREELRINTFFSPFERAYRYAHLEEIRTAPKFRALLGNIVEGREYVFLFQGGGAWFTRWSPKRFVLGPAGNPAAAQKQGIARFFEGMSREDKRKLAKFISEKSGVPITEVDVLR